jgi:hypothetical protein
MAIFLVQHRRLANLPRAQRLRDDHETRTGASSSLPRRHGESARGPTKPFFAQVRAEDGGAGDSRMCTGLHAGHGCPRPSAPAPTARAQNLCGRHGPSEDGPAAQGEDPPVRLGNRRVPPAETLDVREGNVVDKETGEVLLDRWRSLRRRSLHHEPRRTVAAETQQRVYEQRLFLRLRFSRRWRWTSALQGPGRGQSSTSTTAAAYKSRHTPPRRRCTGHVMSIGYGLGEELNTTRKRGGAPQQQPARL